MPSKCSELIGITMGCPVGIGPEIILKYLSTAQPYTGYRPVVIGAFEVFVKCVAELDVEIDLVKWQPGEPVADRGVHIYQPSTISGDQALDVTKLNMAEPDQNTGRAMAQCIESCVELVQQGELAAMVTCPITKAALQKAGYDYPGHTEMLAELCGTSDFAMMMAGKRLRVTLVTIHIALQDVPALLTQDSVVDLINRTGASLRDDFGIAEPRMAVAGLNPHASEGGIFGREEAAVIQPAISRAQMEGWQVSGAYPPDTVFNKAVAGEFDAVVCMYHDQGLIPFKLIHFEDGVNVTIGLPIVRTSVDHGTAYDIAGHGVADHRSLAAAYEMAADIVKNRSKHKG